MVQTKEAKAGQNRWYLIILLCIIYTVYNIDRNLVVILAEPIKAEFSLSDTQLGLLTGTSFAVAFALAGIPLGFLVDRTNRVRLLAILLMIWSAATALCSLVRTFPLLVAARIAVAGAESGAAPTSLSIISDSFPKSRRGTAIGIFYLGTPIGMAAGFAIGGFVAQYIGWREVFLLAGLPGILFSLIVFLTVREPKRGVFDQEEKGAELVSSLGNVFNVLKRKKSLIFLLFAAISMIVAQSGIGQFMASHYVRHYDLPLDRVGYSIAFIMGVGGAVGMPAGGVISDWVSKRSLAFAPRFAGFIAALSIPFAVVGCMAPSLQLSIGAFFIYSIIVHTYLGPTFSTFLSLSPARLRGAMSALLLVGMNLVGFGIGPQLTGIVSDMLNVRGVEEPLRYAMLFMSLFLLVSAMLYWVASKTTNKDAEVDDMA